MHNYITEHQSHLLTMLLIGNCSCFCC